MSLSTSFDSVLTKHKEALASAAALEKATKVIEQIGKIITSAGYKSVDAFYAEVEAISSGKPVVPAKGKTTKATSKASKPKASRKGGGGGRKRFTDEDRAHWKSLYFGPAQGNLKTVERLLKDSGKAVSYQTLFNTAKAEKWGAFTPTPAAS